MIGPFSLFRDLMNFVMFRCGFDGFYEFHVIFLWFSIRFMALNELNEVRKKFEALKHSKYFTINWQNLCGIQIINNKFP